MWCMNMCVGMQEGASSIHVLVQSKSWNPSVSLTCHCQQRGLQAYANICGFYMGARDLNLGPHACTASILPTEPSPQPLLELLNMGA